MFVINITVGRPCKIKNSPDYKPSIFAFSTSTRANSKQNRYERLQKRRLSKRLQKQTSNEVTQRQDVAMSDIIPSVEDSRPDPSVPSCIEAVDSEPAPEVTLLEFNSNEPSDCIEESSVNAPSSSSTIECGANDSTSTSQTCVDRGVNTDDDFESREALLQKLCEQQWLYSLVKAELDAKSIKTSPSKVLENDDKQTHFYTGLPSYSVFSTLLDLLSKAIKPHYLGLSAADQFLMVLMKLRHAFSLKDLGYRFGIDKTRVSRIFNFWINVMHAELQPLVKWPERDIVRRTLPACFKPAYGRAICIIDCSEIFIQRPTSLTARAQTFSNYKSHNTVKFLIAISPTGAIIFVSKCWGGRASDKHITMNSGFLNKLMHGDLVLADRGFDIAEALACHGATLAIPPFTKGKPQLSAQEVETARKLSRVRIHVEHAIGRLKCFKLLQSTLPITLIKKPNDKEYCLVDKTLFVCAALCNLQPPLVP